MRKALVALAAASALLLTACGSDDASTTTTVATEDSMPAETGTVVDVAVANADFSTLVAAVTAAGLAETLSGPGPFTIFAPTNAAFAALPAGLVEKLLLPENKDTLVAILKYHVVGAKVLAADVAAGEVATVEGSTIAITTDDGVKINGSSNVTATDIMGSNGVIHVIDAVLVPPTVDVSAL